MKRKVIPLFLSIILLAALIGCAGLQQKWDKATDDERARIIIRQTQGALRINAELTVAFVEKNPQFKDQWKNKVLPMFKVANDILGDLIKKGKAGQKITYMEVLAAIGGRVTEIITIIQGWGVKVVQLDSILEVLAVLTELEEKGGCYGLRILGNNSYETGNGTL